MYHRFAYRQMQCCISELLCKRKSLSPLYVHFGREERYQRRREKKNYQRTWDFVIIFKSIYWLRCIQFLIILDIMYLSYYNILNITSVPSVHVLAINCVCVTPASLINQISWSFCSLFFWSLEYNMFVNFTSFSLFIHVLFKTSISSVF